MSLISPDTPADPAGRLRLIACEIAYRELCLCVAHAPEIVDVEFVPKGLHDLPTEKMRAALQERIDAADRDLYRAVLLGFGLCNNGVVGLTGRDLPLVLPRAHDCITFFMGDRRRYAEYFQSNPGTFFRTTGWSERDAANVEGAIWQTAGMNRTHQDYVREYGEENARFIMETLGNWTNNYSRMTFIDMDLVPELGHDRAARRDAERNNWTYERIPGDWSLLRRFVAGRWDPDDFLVVPPGHRIAASNDHLVVRAEKTAAGDEPVETVPAQTPLEGP